MNFYVGEPGSSGMNFDSKEDFFKAIGDLIDIYEAEGEDWFEIEIVRD